MVAGAEKAIAAHRLVDALLYPCFASLLPTLSTTTTVFGPAATTFRSYKEGTWGRVPFALFQNQPRRAV